MKSLPLRSLSVRGLVATATLAIAGIASASAGEVKPFTAEYQASYMGMQAIGRMTLAAAGANRWRYSLDIGGSMANLNQTTVFEDRAGQWRPLSNSDSSAVLIKHKQKNAVYDWGKGVASWTGDVKPERAGPVKLQAGDLDAMLVTLSLARDVADGKALSYHMVDDGRAKQLNYAVVGHEAITVGGKSRQATKVVRTDGNKEEVLWLVDDLPVPARILRRKDGADEMDLRLKSMR
ncbi:DUF3108 domain-containing protein [Lysobacter fragariae]